MALDRITAHFAGMTALQLSRHAKLAADGRQVFMLMDHDVEAVLFQMVNPVAAAATGVLWTFTVWAWAGTGAENSVQPVKTAPASARLAMAEAKSFGMR